MLEAVTSTLQESSQTQNYLDELEKWRKVNMIKFNKDKCKVVNLERNNQMLKDGRNCLGGSKDLCYRGQQKRTAINNTIARRPNVILRCFNRYVYSIQA